MPSYSGVFTLQAQMQAIAAGNWTGMPLVIGQAYQGGFYAGQISTSANSVATHNLVIGPISSAQSGLLQWKNANTATPGADSSIDGPQNTVDMVADGNSTVYPCAHFCNDAVIGGFTDWYMPAKNELEVCYYNLKPTTQGNSAGYGINPNAVPARASGYTAGSPATNPARTSSANFRTPATESFLADQYWSSTEATAIYAWWQTFAPGGQYSYYGKSSTRRVRAIRRVPV